MSDETFFTSILMRYFPETIPNMTDDMFLDIGSEQAVSMYAIRYERMDEHVPTSNGYFPIEQRYEVPDSTGVDKPRPWGPYFLGYVPAYRYVRFCLRTLYLVFYLLSIFMFDQK